MNEKKTYTTTLNIELMTEIRELAQRKTKNQNDLIEEAIQDVLNVAFQRKVDRFRV